MNNPPLSRLLRRLQL